MKIFKAKSADGAWLKAAKLFSGDAKVNQTQSRSGPTREILHSGFEIGDPRQRWIFSRKPPLNIAFALAELIWNMNGRNDSAFLTYWNRDLPRFAGGGKTFHGAYGYRLRKSFGFDQLEGAYNTLKSNSISRQVVLQIWSSDLDFPVDNGKPKSEDVPCNIISMLKVREGKLEWMQIIRSNDLFRGLPYDFVQFTFLQEILAGWLRLEVGTYNQISDSLHLYDDDNLFYVKEKSLKNRDSISVDWDSSKKYFFELNVRVEKFISERLNEIEHLKLTNWHDAPQAYRNILFVLSAEAARRRGWLDMSKELISKCKNSAFKKLFLNWFERTETKMNSPRYLKSEVVE